jgi:diketogulonate reductase-like aldo/keto reductase
MLMPLKNSMDIGTTVQLNNGLRMPVFGLGVYQSPPGKVTEAAVQWALEDGYRLIDTAAFYQNETDVGRAVRESGLPRKEIFITTKLKNPDHTHPKEA